MKNSVEEVGGVDCSSGALVQWGCVKVQGCVDWALVKLNSGGVNCCKVALMALVPLNQNPPVMLASQEANIRGNQKLGSE